MTQDQVFVPRTRSERRLPPLDPSKEDPLGASVSEEVKKELREALGDSPIWTTLRAAGYLVGIVSISIILFSPDSLPPDRGMAFIPHP
jgi:omega-6 fatty acid desaturase / acyl-lipid omega-6 desaturase (Delta-12 desaturase)